MSNQAFGGKNIGLPWVSGEECRSLSSDRSPIVYVGNDSFIIHVGLRYVSDIHTALATRILPGLVTVYEYCIHMSVF